MGGAFERHFYYWILPNMFILTVALLYFTGIPLLQTIVAPDFNRELGLLETTQHLLVLAVAGLAVRGYLNSETLLERVGFGAAALLATLQFLEELNYGQHYLALFGLLPAQTEAGPMSLHNIEGVSSQLKRVGDAVIALYFFLFPLLGAKSSIPWVRYLAPPRLMVVTVLSSVVMSRFLHFVSDNTPVNNSAFITGVSEFREAFTYYFVLIYVRELALNRRWPGFGSEK